MIYHITSRDAWRDAQEQGAYLAPSLESEGFIHCSARAQILDVAKDFYSGQTNLLLLCIDESRLNSDLRWEAPAHRHPAKAESTQGEARFPHIYGALNIDAIIAVFDFPECDSGYTLPPELP